MKNFEFKMSDFEWIEITINFKLKPREQETVVNEQEQDSEDFTQAN